MTAKPGSRWLILSHAFNMDGRAASHTITDKIPHLLANGIEPIIISATTGRLDDKLEHYQLLPLGPSGLRFDLRHVLRKRWGKDWRYRLVTLAATLTLLPATLIEKLLWRRESQWSWWWPAYRKGLQLIRAGKIDVIYSTGGAYAAHVAGARLKQKTGLPWLAEVHDPLYDPARLPMNSQRRMQLEVERLICTHADVPFWFTEQALASALTRQPQMGSRGRMMLPGVDAPDAKLPPYQPGESLVIGHFGSLSPTRHLGGIIEAIAKFSGMQPDAAAAIELHIYGTGLDAHTQAALERFGGQVKIRHFGRLEYDPVSGKSGRTQVLERMRNADVLLLHHGVEPVCAEYIPSKFYEYLWMQRPILGLVHHNPQLERMLRQAGHIAVPAEDIQAQVAEIGELYAQWRSDGLPDNGQDSPYTTQAAVGQLVSWTQQALQRKA